MSTINSPQEVITWAKVEENFYVGSRQGEFLGYIDKTGDAVFVATDMVSRQLGEFASLTEAMDAVSLVEQPAANIAEGD